MGSKPTRIDESLMKLIKEKQKALSNETGININFPDASRSLAHDYIELKTNRKLKKKEIDFFKL